MLQARYELPVPVLDRGRTLTGFAAADAVTRLKRCVVEFDAANACFLAADLLASGHGARLVDGLVDMVADARFLVPAFALGVADDVADLAVLTHQETAGPPTSTALGFKGSLINDSSARHLAVQAVVRLCLLAKPGRSRGGETTSHTRAAALVRAHGAKLITLQAEVVPMLKNAAATAQAGADMVGKVTAALALLRTQEGEARRWRMISLVARGAPAAISALLALADASQLHGAGPHARVANLLARARPTKAPALLLAAFAGPSPLEAPPWTRAERSNVTYAVMRAHVLFESVAGENEGPSREPPQRHGAEQDAQQEVIKRVLREAREGRVDPDVSRGVDATFRRKARLDALYRV